MAQHVSAPPCWEHSPEDPGSWQFVTLPPELSEDIALEAGPRREFGSVRVEATVGTTTWRTSLFPDAGTGGFVLPVKRSVRQAEDLHAGGICQVRLEVMPLPP